MSASVRGHELFTRTPRTRTGKTYGASPPKAGAYNKNIYVLESGNWVLGLKARHANVISEQRGGGPVGALNHLVVPFSSMRGPL